MSVTIKPTPLQPIMEFNENKELEHLIDTDLINHSPSKRLRKQIHRWDDKLLHDFVMNRLLPLGGRITNAARQITVEGKLALVKQKAQGLIQSDAKLRNIFETFETHITEISAAPEAGSSAIGLANMFTCYRPFLGAFSLTYQQNVRKQRLINHIAQLSQKFRSLTSEKGTDWQKELREEFLKLNPDEMTAVVKELNYQQVSQLITSSLLDQKMAELLPRLLVSLKHETIEQLLEKLPKQELELLNDVLKSSSDVKSPWFQEMFKVFRDGFIKELNTKRYDIDELNKVLRDLPKEQINKGHIEQLELFRSDLQKRHDRLKQLCILVNGIVDVEVRYLMTEGLPNAYDTLIRRLSDNESDIRKDAGAPYGILFRKVFEDAKVDDFAPAAEIYKLWNVDAALSGRALHADINLVRDLKHRKIFNKTMLTKALEKE